MEGLCGARFKPPEDEDDDPPLTCLEQMKQTGYLAAMKAFTAIPTPPFDAASAPAAPDYAAPDSWLAFPGMPSVVTSLEPPTSHTVDVVPTVDAPPAAPGVPPEGDGGADVFFVHSSAYFGGEWNAAFDHAASQERTQLFASSQVAAFHGICRVYMPQYREAALGAYFCGSRDDARAAFDLAYSDVRRAFEHYLAHHNRGRPFFLAAHSQGSGHASRLLEDVVEPRHAELGARLIAAYLVGAGLPMRRFEHLPHVPPCDGPTDLCCVAGWDVRAGGLQGAGFAFPPLYHRTWPGAWYGGRWRVARGDGRILGTNPYTWRNAAPRGVDVVVTDAAADDGAGGAGGGSGAASGPSPSSLNLGVAMPVLFDPNRVLVPALQVAQFQSDAPSGFVPAHLATLAPEVAFPGATDPTKALDVHFDEATNWLVVPNVARDGGVANRFKPRVDGAFHVYDWAFFFGNVRQNVRDRLAAHTAKYG